MVFANSFYFLPFHQELQIHLQRTYVVPKIYLASQLELRSLGPLTPFSQTYIYK